MSSKAKGSLISNSVIKSINDISKQKAIWKRERDVSLSLLSQIATKMNDSNVLESIVDEGRSIEKVKGKLSIEIDEIMTKVNYSFATMVEILTNLNDVLSSFTFLYEKYGELIPLRTLSLKDMERLVKEIADMHTQEALVKGTILDHFLTEKDFNVLNVYLTSWMMEPYIDLERLKEIENIFELDMLKSG